MQEVTNETFDQEVIQSNKPVVIDFWGPQCAPCRALMPQVEALEKKYQHKVKIVKLEAPKNRRVCLSLKVISLPTFLFYKDGKEIDRLSGEVTIKKVEESLEKIL